MNPVVIGNATLYLGECADILDDLSMSIDAVVTDPPYGIGEAAGRAKTRSGPAGIGGGKYTKDYGDDNWDDEPIDDYLIEKIRTMGQSAIIFGGNYYALPPTSCWLVWDKLNGDTDFADCELAWTNLKKATRLKRYLWNGMLRANKEIRGDHPTQKPIGVMEWAISHLPMDTRTILDPFMGSGTTGVACYNLGRSFIGIERKTKYFDIACRRIDDAQRQGRLIA